MGAVNDREIRGAGTLEAVWLPWLAEQCVTGASMNDLCPGTARLVVVSPHPDDEILACGGLLALRAELGLPCLVVAVTNGEASHGSLDPLACAQLGAQRAEESYAGLRALGLPSTCVVRLGIPDGKAANMMSDIALKLFPLLMLDDVIVTTWSLDGHPDHEAASDATRTAAAKAGCRLLEAPVWMWHWGSPSDARIPWARLVAFDLPLRAQRAKQEALSCHRSQFEKRRDGLDAVLVPSIVDRAARSREYFFQ